jgi:uncharacterized metal-binding protein YceD (DUF177 family)
MKLQVKKLNALKKYTGDFKYEYHPSADLVSVPLCHFDGAVIVEGNYEIYDDDTVDVSFRLKYRLVGQCSYCLNDASKDIDESFDVLYVPYEDDDNYSYDGINVDLTHAVDDAILFSQPNVILCRDDCQGIDIINNK